jgi:hypothetical protein
LLFFARKVEVTMPIRAKAGLMGWVHDFGAQMATLTSVWRNMSGIDPAGLRRLFEDNKLLTREYRTDFQSAQSPSKVLCAPAPQRTPYSEPIIH